MKYIAHRGLFSGPDSASENNPKQIEYALSCGYECEVDLWVDDGLKLGHDHGQYCITESWLNDKMWIHAKNIEALLWLTSTRHTFFWHESDQYTLTSNGYIWTFPGCKLTERSIMVMPEHSNITLENTQQVKCHGICSDFINKIKERNENSSMR